jgi:hypothetical protein
MDKYVLKLINEYRSTINSNCGIATPYGLLRIQNLLPFGKWGQKKRKKKKEKKTNR